MRVAVQRDGGRGVAELGGDILNTLPSAMRTEAKKCRRSCSGWPAGPRASAVAHHRCRRLSGSSGPPVDDWNTSASAGGAHCP